MKSVYFIKPIGMSGPIKIGCSISPDGRVETLATWCPVPLELVAFVTGGHDVERRFHAKFQQQHIGHEWFSNSEELDDTISAILADAFDLSTLPQPVNLRKTRGKANPFNRNSAAVEIINNLGGTTAVARRLGVPVTTVQAWKQSGIPKGRSSQLIGIADSIAA